MSRSFLVASLVYGSSIICSAQAYRYANADNIASLNTVLTAHANYSAKSYNVAFQDITNSPGSYSLIQSYGSEVYSIFGTYVYWNFMYNPTMTAPVIAINYGWSTLLQAFGPGAFGLLAAQMWASSENTQYRLYSFTVPVDGNYLITCGLKGGWDTPRNRVRLYDANGNIVSGLDYNDQLASDGSFAFPVNCARGNYTLSVGIGSGSSSLFHTAGSLSAVYLNETTNKQWTLPLIVACNQENLVSILPAVGSQNIVNVMFSGFPPTSDPNILDGLPITYSDLQPLPNAFVTYVPPCHVTGRSNIGCQTTYPTVTSSMLLFDGTTATYSVTRGLDAVLIVDGLED